MSEKKIICKQIILTGKGKPTFCYFLSLRVPYSDMLEWYGFRRTCTPWVGGWLRLYSLKYKRFLREKLLIKLNLTFLSVFFFLYLFYFILMK